MGLLDFRRGVAGIRLLVDFASAEGITASDALSGSGVEPHTLAEPEGEVSAAQELRVLRNIAQRLGHPAGLGLRIGHRYQLGNFGPWGYGLMSVATFGEALERAIRFLPLTFAFCVIRYQVEGDEVVLHFGEPALPVAMRRMLVERDMMTAVMLMQQLLGDGFRLRRFELRAMGGPVAPLPRDFRVIAGVTPERNALRDALAFDAALLQQRPPFADPASAAMFDGLCKRLMDRRRADVGTVAIVRQLLQAHPPGELPTLGQVARLLHVSERTLKRRLHDEDSSFRELLAGTQAEVAAELVRDTSMSLTHVADRMGYADLSAFSQAFKRWHGVAPEHFRRTHPASR